MRPSGTKQSLHEKTIRKVLWYVEADSEWANGLPLWDRIREVNVGGDEVMFVVIADPILYDVLISVCLHHTLTR